MRNRLKKCVLFAVSLSMLLSLSLTASASEAKPLESEKITVYNGDGQYIPIIDKGIFGQSRAVSASCCVAFHSAYVQYASFKRLAGHRNGLCLTL